MTRRAFDTHRTSAAHLFRCLATRYSYVLKPDTATPTQRSLVQPLFGASRGRKKLDESKSALAVGRPAQLLRPSASAAPLSIGYWQGNSHYFPGSWPGALKVGPGRGRPGGSVTWWVAASGCDLGRW